MRAINLLTIISMLYLISACGPRMQQVKNYIPPVTDFGKSCLERADRDRNSCEVTNQDNIAQCYSNAQIESERILELQERDYTVALEDYIDAQTGYELLLADYEEQQRLIRADGELAYVRCSNDVNMTRMAEYPECRKLVTQANKRANRLAAPDEPIRPVRPSLQSILSDLHRQCRSEAINCGQLYDEAYVSCGGQIEYQSICVANCDG